MKPLDLVLVLATCLGAGVARADSLVCKQGQVVRPGISAEELLEKCGKPASAESKTEDLRTLNPMGNSVKVGEVYSEIWRYDRGSQKPAAIVLVTEGKVMSITFED
jgi:hypothetical protein